MEQRDTRAARLAMLFVRFRERAQRRHMALAIASICASSWITAVGLMTPVPAGNEYLPPRNASVAWMDEHQEAVGYTLARIAWHEGSSPDTPPAHVDDAATLGKRLHVAAASSFGSFVREGIAPTRVPYLSVEDSRWASCISVCERNASAWACMFGENPRPPPEDEECEMVWHAARFDAPHRDTAAMVVIAGAIATALAPEPRSAPYAVHARFEKSVPERWGSGEFVAVHIRRVGACDVWLDERPPFQPIFQMVYGDTSPCFTWPTYERELLRMADLYNVSNALILSEDSDAVREATKSLHGKMNVIWVDVDRARTSHGKGLLENGDDADENTALGTLASMHIARNAVALVGHMYSHLDKAIHLLIAGHRGVAPPWISMDGGGVRSWDMRASTVADGLADVY